jgi:hypothetical protein
MYSQQKTWSPSTTMHLTQYFQLMEYEEQESGGEIQPKLMVF